MTQTSWPAHDPATRRWLPETSTPVDPGRVESLLAAEWDKFAANTPASADHNRRASKTLPLGTTARVTNLESGKSAVVEIRDRGPVQRKRRSGP